MAHLVSPACSTTGGFYSSGAGRVARVVTAEASGWTSPGDKPPSPEDIAANWEAIDEPVNLGFPSPVEDSLAILGREVQAAVQGSSTRIEFS